MQKKTSNKVTAGTGNIFADLKLPQSNELLVKAELARKIQQRIKALKLTQAQAAVKLGLKQPDVSKICRGRHLGFTLDRLIKLLNKLEIDVEIVLHPPRKKSRKTADPGKVRVLTETV